MTIEVKAGALEGLKLTPVWQVLYKTVWMEKAGRGYQILFNNEATGNWVAQHNFKSKEAAVAALNELIRESCRDARVETRDCGGFGIDIVVDEQVANDERIVDWKIRMQYKSDWEITEEMGGI